VDVVALGRCDDATEAFGGAVADVVRFDGVETERGDMVVRLAQPHGQVDHGSSGETGFELLWPQLSPPHRPGRAARVAGGHAMASVMAPTAAMG
jgi:hypothetical protein